MGDDPIGGGGQTRKARERPEPKTAKRPPKGPFRCKKSGGVLLSQADSSQVPSALEGLTSVFGMGTGVTPLLWPPKSVVKEMRPTTGVAAHELFKNSIASTNICVLKPSGD